MVKVKILLVDDHMILREGLRSLFANEVDFEVVGEADDGREALLLTEELQPDVVLMDVSMPNLNGIEATRQIRRYHPEVKVVILSMYADEMYVYQALQAGASGYVLKQGSAAEASKAIRAVYCGRAFFSAQISHTVINNYARRAKNLGSKEIPELLTSREREVLQPLVEGMTNRDIAQQLGISVKTVERHRSNMMSKLGLNNKTELIRYALGLSKTIV